MRVRTNFSWLFLFVLAIIVFLSETGFPQEVERAAKDYDFSQNDAPYSLKNTLKSATTNSVTSLGLSGDTGWPMYQANPSHTGYTPTSLVPSQLVLRWQKTLTPNQSLNPVAAGDGKVFVSTYVYFNAMDQFFALDAGSGNILWKMNFGSIYSVNPPSYAYGNVYIQTGNHSSDTYLWAFKGDTGSLVFRSPFSAQWERYYAPTVYDGSIYIDGGYYGGMYSFDAFTGARNWYKGLPQYDEWTPAVNEQTAFAYVGDYSPGVYAIDRRTGVQQYFISDPNFDWNGWSMSLAPVLGSDNTLLAIHNGRLISFDLGNQNIKWQLSRSFAGQLSLAKGIIYALDGGALTAWDEKTGSFLWTWATTTGNLTGTIIVTDTHVLVRNSTRVFAVDLTSHTDVWSYPASGHLALSERTLYLAGANGVLTAISLGPETKEFLPVVSASIQDRPRDGLGDGFNSASGFLLLMHPRESRAIVEFDPGNMKSRTITQGTLDFAITMDKQGGAKYREFNIVLYAGNGIADLQDFSVEGISAGKVGYDVSSGTTAFHLDVTSAVRQLFASGATNIGMRIEPLGKNNFDSTLQNSKLTLTGL